jgi:hypothetical protein
MAMKNPPVIDDVCISMGDFPASYVDQREGNDMVFAMLALKCAAR